MMVNDKTLVMVVGYTTISSMLRDFLSSKKPKLKDGFPIWYYQYWGLFISLCFSKQQNNAINMF